jgi:hypothetical protein
MENSQNEGNYNWQYDLRSKLLDGVFASGLLILLLLVLRLIITSIGNRFGRLGLLNMDVGLIAIAIFCLDRSLSSQRSDAAVSWFGAIGGLVAWMAAELSFQVGQTPLVTINGLILLILTALIVFTLWKNGLSVGGQYFFAVFLLTWLAKYVLASQTYIAYWLQVFSPEFHLLGYAALVCVAACAVWIIFKTQHRQERIWTALWMWFFSVLVLGSFLPFYV